MTSNAFLQLVRIVFVTCILTFAVVGSVGALDLDTAKDKGLVGEMENGYLGPIKTNPPAAVRELIGRVNAARKKKYQDIANRNGTPLEAVESLAAQKAYEKTAKGHYLQLESGEWGKK